MKSLFVLSLLVFLFLTSPVLAANPTGWLDSASCSNFTGWTCDSNNYNQALDVHFYTDNNQWVGSTTANNYRSDLASAGVCGGTGSHGFSFTTPDFLKTGQNRNIYAYGINIGPGNNNLLSGSPKSIFCVLPPPTPAISLNTNCTSTNTDNLATISWSSTSPQVTYADISATSNFSTWFYKEIPAGATSTPVSSGFHWSSSTLTLQPNTTYYVRLWNGTYHSSTASFTTPGSCLNNAQPVSPICPPSPLTTGQTLPMSITMNNNGSTTWTRGGNYNLGSQNPPDNNNWGLSRVGIGWGVTSRVLPGENYTFPFSITAPTISGTYNFQWQMVQDGVQWFGNPTPNCQISVQAPVIPTGSIRANPNPCAIPWGESQCSSTISWTTTNAQNVSVVTGGSTFSSGLASGSKVANGITTSGTTFNLYAGNTWLATLIATGALAPSPTPTPTAIPTPTTVPTTPTPTPTPQIQNTNCYDNSKPIRMDGGLLSTTDAQLGNISTTGYCILDPRASIPNFSVPTYPKLKSLYFDQLRANSTRYVKETISGNANQGNIQSKLGGGNDQDTIIYASGDLTFNSSFNPSFTKPIVIFVDGDLSINNNLTFGSSNSDRGLVFIVQGAVKIDKSVTQVNAFIINFGQFCSGWDNNSCPSSISASQLVINGSVVSLPDNATNRPRFVRTLTNNSQPAEKIVFQPKYLIILKDIFSRDLTIWKEIQ